MKRSLFLLIIIFTLCSLLLIGCGESTPPPGKVTTYFHVQDQFTSPIPNASFTYSDPSNQTFETSQTNSNGNITMVSTKVGIYSWEAIKYNSITYSLSPPLQFYILQEYLDNNFVFSYTITFNTSTGAISVIRNY